MAGALALARSCVLPDGVHVEVAARIERHALHLGALEEPATRLPDVLHKHNVCVQEMDGWVGLGSVRSAIHEGGWGLNSVGVGGVVLCACVPHIMGVGMCLVGLHWIVG